MRTAFRSSEARGVPPGGGAMRACSAAAIALGCGSLLGCASGAAERRTDEVAAPQMSSADQAVQVDRLDEINRICQRKAGIAVPRCWNDEYMRTGKKFEAQVTLMIVVSAGGQAEDVKIIGSTTSSKELQKCITDEARGWAYPEGKVSAHVNCSFFLRSSM